MRHEEEEQGRGRRQGFLPPISKKGVPMIMEPLVYLLVTATTLTRHLAYLRQAMACSIDYQSIYAYDYIYTYRVTLSVTYKDDK